MLKIPGITCPFWALGRITRRSRGVKRDTLNLTPLPTEAVRRRFYRIHPNHWCHTLRTPWMQGRLRWSSMFLWTTFVRWIQQMMYADIFVHGVNITVEDSGFVVTDVMISINSNTSAFNTVYRGKTTGFIKGAQISLLDCLLISLCNLSLLKKGKMFMLTFFFYEKWGSIPYPFPKFFLWWENKRKIYVSEPFHQRSISTAEIY